MSADDTIGILVTRRRDGSDGCEYRVAHTQAIENIDCEPDYPSAHNPVFNRQEVRLRFGSTRVFFSIEEAMCAAQKLERKIGYVEYGIRVLDFSAVNFPASDRKRERRRFSRNRHA